MRLSLYYHTIKYLRLSQVFWRLRKKLPRVSIDRQNLPVLRPQSGIWISSIVKPQSFFPPDQFCFLNVSERIASVADWNNKQFDRLWLYNLHYFDDLAAIDANNRLKPHLQLIHRWIKENPPGEKTGWEPYPLSLRIINWIKWSLSFAIQDQDLVDSLALQVRWLRHNLEYHLLGNHLYENAKALVFGGMFFEGKEADEWLNKGFQLLQDQLQEQILDDGGHFERSPMYHAIVLEGLLDLINMSRVYEGIVENPYLSHWEDTCLKMLRWYRIMCHPDGHPSFFNDTAFNIAPDLEPIVTYAKRLGLDLPEIDQELVDLKDSGYVRVSKDDIYLIVDTGNIGPDYLPGHAHADTLSYELSLAGQRVFVNSGISCYGVSSERLYQRSTDAHNSLSVDGKSSSEIWSGFRVARRAKITDKKIKTKANEFYIKARHNGFARIKSVGEHTRIFKMNNHRIEIRDQVTGIGEHFIKVSFHIHPDLNAVAVKGSENTYLLENFESTCLARLSCHPDHVFKLADSYFYPEFGLKIPNKSLVLEARTALPVEIPFTIELEPKL